MTGFRPPLQTFQAPTGLKLAVLWASVMFCYVYGDYFGLYAPGKLAKIEAGQMGFGLVTADRLMVVALVMAVPALMIALSVLLPAVLSRWINVILGIAYSGIMVLTMLGGAPPFYIALGLIEVALTGAITIIAWRWPRESRES